jgi:glycosyltransferase involved in cell wall biosynthesis
MAERRVDFDKLDRYLAMRYEPSRRVASVALKTLMPVATIARDGVEGDPADVVLLHPHLPGRRRHARIVASLEKRGLRVSEEILPLPGEMVGGRKLAEPAGGWPSVPRRWRLQAAYAAWLVARYRPRLVVTFMDDTVHTPFLHAALARIGAALANMSHTICFPIIDFSMCDVDWFVLFGERSLENLTVTPVRYGACRAIVAGSPYLVGDTAAAARAATPRDPPRLLWIGQYVPPTQRATLERDLASLARFAGAHPEYAITVRTHPLDTGETHAFLARLAPGLAWMAPEGLLPEVLGDFDIVLSSFSAGLIDAAAYGKPIVAFSTNGLAATLGLREAGLPLVADDIELARAVAQIRGDYARASSASVALARQHYHGLDDATERIADLFATLARGGEPAALGLPMRDLDEKMPPTAAT